MGKKVILFDFDGTLADSVEAGILIFNQLAARYGFLGITPENTQILREKSPREAMKELKISFLYTPLVVRGLRNGLRIKIPELKVAGDMKSILFSLKERGYELGIVTTNSEKNVRGFLRNNEIEIFDYVHAGVSLFGKARAIKKAISRYGLEDREIIYVGDEIRDIEAAQKNNIKVVSVTWGLNSRTALESRKPDFVVDAHHELAEVL